MRQGWKSWRGKGRECALTTTRECGESCLAQDSEQPTLTSERVVLRQCPRRHRRLQESAIPWDR
jgi:hypothetical protein